MLRIPLALSTGTGAASFVGASAVLAIQGSIIGTESLVSGTFVVQLAFLISAGGMLVYAGRIVGQWQSAQKQLIEDVAAIDKANLELRERVSQLEGVVKMMDDRFKGWQPGQAREKGA